MFRALGVISLIVAVFLVLVCVLILVTFFFNLHASLLILLVIAAAFAWVFFAIGWQLVRPPHPSADAEDGSETASPAEAAVGGGQETPAGAACISAEEEQRTDAAL